LQAQGATSSIFAQGDLSQPQVIVDAMRAGAREYLDRPTSTAGLLEAFVRLSSEQRKAGGSRQQGKIFLVVNAKGGNGATTVAVNTALSLHSTHGSTALVDLAPIGHAALHLNLQPPFSVHDALQNLHRLDASLLDSFMVRHDGLHLLAGTMAPLREAGAGELARLFDVLVAQYSYVVVDASSRLDECTRLIGELSDLVLLVANADVISLWSAGRVREYLGKGAATERFRLVLNRFRKIPGFHESDAEEASGAKLAGKIPNHFPVVSNAIDRGTPVIQSHSELARSFAALATAITETEESKRKTWSLFKTA
jgi:pilus assembly protein CpaE